MILIFINLIWIFYSLLEGYREAFYWHYKNSNSNIIKEELDIHIIFSTQRGIVLILIGLLLFNYFKWISILYVLSLMLIFSFFHNGMYYKFRNKLNGSYKLGWKDQSTTSTAKMTKIMTYRNRTLFMILGFLIEIFLYFHFK